MAERDDAAPVSPDQNATAQFAAVPAGPGGFRRPETRYAELNPLETTNSLTGRILGPRNAEPDVSGDTQQGSRTALTMLILLGAVAVLALAGIAMWFLLA